MRTAVVSTRRQAEAGTKRGAEIIRGGGLVAFPTETVYGLGANGFDEEAVLKIFEAKGRPADNPLILHVSKKSDLHHIWRRMPKLAQQLMDTFWPGPLTLIGLKSDRVPPAVTAGLDTVAVRMPLDKTARMLISKSERPIAAPSANASGRPSPTTAAHVLADLDGKIDLILDGGPCKFGVESTVLSLIGEPVLLRPGAVTHEMLEAVIGPVRIADAVLSPMQDSSAPASPGMKHAHYAPEAEVIVVCGEPVPVARKINGLYHEAAMRNTRCEIIATEQTKMFYNDKKCVIIGDRAFPETLCENLFSALRDIDKRAELILAEGIPVSNMGLAYMNRLLRAAGFRFIDA
jgi:L-threonylcarbamoyladenylate synthase